MFRKLGFVFFLGLSSFFVYLYYTQHFKWRHCFSGLARCFDSESGVVFQSQSGGVYLALAALFAGCAIFLIWLTKRPSS